MHKLLEKQLKRLKLTDEFVANNHHLIELISDTYLQHERNSAMLERSLFLTSSELNERNEALKEQLDSVYEVKNQLRDSLGLLTATFNATADIIFVYGLDGNITTLNSMGEALFESYKEYYNEGGLDFYRIVKDPSELRHQIDKLKQEPYNEVHGYAETIDNKHYEYASLPQIQDGVIRGRVWCVRDVTAQKQNEATIQYQAYHDALTGLPNRSLLLDRLKHAIALAKREQQKVAVLFLDLDNFKKVNDTEGHDAGDMLLREVVQRLTGRLRDQDTLSRQGGDEFVIVLENIKSENRVKKVCEALLEEMAKPFDIGSRQYYVTSSIGIALYPMDGVSAEELIRKADMSMYQSKEAGKNGFRFYSHELEVQALEQLTIEQALRNMLKREGISLAFQPKYDLSTGKISSLEVLSRWAKPDGSYVSPGLFIPIAEQTGLIEDIGCQVIRKSCEYLHHWRTQDVDVTISINLSSIEFQSERVIRHLLATLNDFSIPGEKIIIELTESIFMEDTEEVIAIMRRLSQQGITFALDDFGKGYSSFSYLHSLPLQYLKIDKAFLADVSTSEQSANITKTIIDIGHNLGLKVIAEGIEDERMLEYVIKHGCDIGQGYYLSRPVNGVNLLPYLQDNKSVF